MRRRVCHNGLKGRKGFIVERVFIIKGERLNIGHYGRRVKELFNLKELFKVNNE